MFNKIAPSYNILNRILSFGVDIYWRHKGLNIISKKNRDCLLDLGCGTGDVSISAYRKGFRNITGVDFSENMLDIFKKKGKDKFKYICSEAENLPLENNSFKSAVSAFAVRNFADREKACSEVYRVLEDDGDFIVIEFSLPKNIFFAKIYKFYFYRVLPYIGGLISRDKEAYRYLPESVKNFPPPDKFMQMIKSCGFRYTKMYSLTGGIAYIYHAKK